MRLTFLGVRGSTPAEGAEFLRYGGHTSCLAVAAHPEAPPTLVLDAGTGLRSLTALLDGQPFRGTMLLTHLHWDHVMGMPFVPALDRSDAEVDVRLPAQGQRSGEDLISQLLSPPAFPIGPDGLNGQWTFTAEDPGAIDVPGWDVTAIEVTHKGGRTYGYIVATADGQRVAYLPDHAPALGLDSAVVDALQGVDVLIHDAQMVESERRFADLYAHATIDDAVAFAEQVGAGRLVMFHHSPSRTDDQLDALAADGPPGLVWAYQGMILDVGRPTTPQV